MKKKRDWVKIIAIILAVMFFIFWIGAVFMVIELEEELELRNSPNRNLNLVEEINKNYYNAHTFSSTDFFVCADMVVDVWNLIKTNGINAKICAGNVEKDSSINSILDIQSEINYLNQVNHAWVMAEISPFEFIAVETTLGILVFKEESEEEVIKNELYYKEDLCFNSPSEFKRFIELRRDLIQTCEEAQEMIDYWNKNYVGKSMTSKISEYKGRMDLKREECEDLDIELFGLLI